MNFFLDTVTYPADHVGGLLILPESEDRYREAVQSALAQGVQVVFLDRIIPEMPVSSVASDHFTEGYLATNHLLEQHNMPVYYLGYTTLLSSTRLWVEGWTAAMNLYNYFDLNPYKFDLSQIPQEIGARRLSHQEILMEAAGRIFDSKKSSQYCIFAGNNYVARAVYFAAEQRELRIGKDVFVVGTGDAPRCDNLKVPLTSVWQSTEQVGYEGAKLLHQLIDGKIKRPVNRLMPVRLDIRQSSMGFHADENPIDRINNLNV